MTLEETKHTKQFFLQDIDDIKFPDQNIVAVLTPHAGYKYSGSIASSIYGSIDWKNFNKIIMFRSVAGFRTAHKSQKLTLLRM